MLYLIKGKGRLKGEDMKLPAFIKIDRMWVEDGQMWMDYHINKWHPLWWELVIRALIKERLCLTGKKS